MVFNFSYKQKLEDFDIISCLIMKDRFGTGVWSHNGRRDLIILLEIPGFTIQWDFEISSHIRNGYLNLQLLFQN